MGCIRPAFNSCMTQVPTGDRYDDLQSRLSAASLSAKHGSVFRRISGRVRVTVEVPLLAHGMVKLLPKNVPW